MSLGIKSTIFDLLNQCDFNYDNYDYWIITYYLWCKILRNIKFCRIDIFDISIFQFCLFESSKKVDDCLDIRAFDHIISHKYYILIRTYQGFNKILNYTEEQIKQGNIYQSDIISIWFSLEADI